MGMGDEPETKRQKRRREAYEKKIRDKMPARHPNYPNGDGIYVEIDRRKRASPSGGWGGSSGYSPISGWGGPSRGAASHASTSSSDRLVELFGVIVAAAVFGGPFCLAYLSEEGYFRRRDEGKAPVVAKKDAGPPAVVRIPEQGAAPSLEPEPPKAPPRIERCVYLPRCIGKRSLEDRMFCNSFAENSGIYDRATYRAHCLGPKDEMRRKYCEILRQRIKQPICSAPHLARKARLR